MKIQRVLASAYQVGGKRFFRKRAAVNRAIWLMVTEEMGPPSEEDSQWVFDMRRNRFEELMADYKAGRLAIPIETERLGKA